MQNTYSKRDNLFGIGAVISFKYQNKWTIGIVRAKTKSFMEITIYETPDKPKEISLKMSDVWMYFFIKKTLKLLPNTINHLKINTSIEYKYKNKDWKNGIVTNKTKDSIIIVIYKTINKKKEITLKTYEITYYLYIKKTLKISNIIYPSSWIRFNQNVLIYNDNNNNSIPEYGKICQYRDNKFICIYFPRYKHEKRLLIIKQKNISQIDLNGIKTKNKLEIIPLSSSSLYVKIFVFVFNHYKIPYEICAIIYKYSEYKHSSNSIPMYNTRIHMHGHMNVEKVPKVWPVNLQNVYGVEFGLKESIDNCIGVCINVNFGKVKTYAVLASPDEVIRSPTALMDNNNDKHDDIRKFRWHRPKQLKKGFVYKIGFYVSDGAAALHYLDYHKDSPKIKDIHPFSYLQWRFFHRENNLSGWRKFDYSTRTYCAIAWDWYPFVRLLVL